MGYTVAQNRKTTQQREVTHDRETRGGVNPPTLSDGNNPHDLPNPDVSRADFFDRQALLARIVPTPKSPYKSRTYGRGRRLRFYLIYLAFFIILARGRQ